MTSARRRIRARALREGDQALSRGRDRQESSNANGLILLFGRAASPRRPRSTRPRAADRRRDGASRRGARESGAECARGRFGAALRCDTGSLRCADANPRAPHRRGQRRLARPRRISVVSTILELRRELRISPLGVRTQFGGRQRGRSAPRAAIRDDRHSPCRYSPDCGTQNMSCRWGRPPCTAAAAAGHVGHTAVALRAERVSSTSCSMRGPDPSPREDRGEHRLVAALSARPCWRGPRTGARPGSRCDGQVRGTRARTGCRACRPFPSAAVDRNERAPPSRRVVGSPFALQIGAHRTGDRTTAARR